LSWLLAPGKFRKFGPGERLQAGSFIPGAWRWAEY
jgi:hypothetical protein